MKEPRSKNPGKTSLPGKLKKCLPVVDMKNIHRPNLESYYSLMIPVESLRNSWDSFSGNTLCLFFFDSLQIDSKKDYGRTCYITCQ